MLRQIPRVSRSWISKFYNSKVWNITMSTAVSLRKKQSKQLATDKKDDVDEISSILKPSRDVSEVNILLGLIIFRLCNVFLVQTWFVPDEYWQGPEVAHGMVYGYGYKTWEWREGIRGYSYPLLFAVLFKCINFLRLDLPIVLVYSPRILQAICGAFGELYAYKFARLIISPKGAWWMLFCQVMSWFTFYCITRTITNSMETVLISIALYYWQFSQSNNITEPVKRTSLLKALILASLSCLVRPTAMVVWLPLGISRLWNSKSKCNFLFKNIFPVGIGAIAFSVALDSWFYHKLIFVQYNFLYFNIMQNIGEIYGTHPWHWYLTQGFPVVLSTHLLPFFIGLFYSGKKFINWLLLILINISVYSALSHKEFRFILPITPIAMCICGEGMHQMADKWMCSVKKDDDTKKSMITKGISCTFKGKVLAMFLIITNIPAALYTGLIHQRGTLDVMLAIGNQLQNKNNTQYSVLFLMPCHSTPYYSYIHKKNDMKFLDCTPNTKLGYIDEADQFYKNPMKWLNENYKGKQETYHLPSHIVLFNVLLKDIRHFLWEHMYTKCGDFFYSHFPSGRIGQSVLLYCKTVES